MAFETYPSKKHCKQWGMERIPDAKGGTRFPCSSLPCTKDDRDMSRIKQHGNGNSPPGDTYSKGPPGHKRFASREGLPG